MPLPEELKSDSKISNSFLSANRKFQLALDSSKESSPLKQKYRNHQVYQEATYLKSLKKYEGNWAYGYPDGDGHAMYANGDTYEGQFSNGVR